LLKSAAKERSAELLADFENQMGQQYSFDQDETWEKAVKAAEAAIAKAQAQIHARCRELGIPDQFAPAIDVTWYRRGDSATASRRKELRSMAQTRIAAIERKAIVQIEMASLEAQTALAVTGLTSDVGRRFVEALPKIEALMPLLSFSEVAGDAEPPVAEHLISSNALRQQRWRERQALRRNDQKALHNAPCVTGNTDTEDDN
jgi:hypothetical protein